MKEIIKIILEHPEDYSIETEDTVFDEELNDWVTKKVKKISVSIDTIIDVCTKYNIPFPADDLDNMFRIVGFDVGTGDVNE